MGTGAHRDPLADRSRSRHHGDGQPFISNEITGPLAFAVPIRRSELISRSRSWGVGQKTMLSGGDAFLADRMT